MEKYQLAFSLLANARAFLESSVGYIRRNDPDENKFAILHLATALELLLKARVAVLDPAMLAVGKRVSDEQLERGEFRSVGTEQAVDILAEGQHLVLSDRQLKQLAALRSMRNRVIHFVSSIKYVDTRAAIGAGIHLFIEIHRSEFADEDVYRAKAMSRIVEELNDFREFVDERLCELLPRLASAERPRTRHFDECAICLQDATVIEGDTVSCLFCGEGGTITQTTERLSRNGTAELCPACGRLSVAYHRWKDEEPTYECFCCGYFRGPELRWSDGKNPISRLRF